MFMYYSTGYDDDNNLDFLSCNREMYSVPSFFENN
jgi:hypothetical protein